MGKPVPVRFCTAINCIDGRVQDPVSAFMRSYFGAEFVDTVTEAGPCRILSERNNAQRLDGILDRVLVSCEAHQSNGIAVVAHHDCAGNPVSPAVQSTQLRSAVSFLDEAIPGLPIIALWVDANWQVAVVE